MTGFNLMETGKTAMKRTAVSLALTFGLACMGTVCAAPVFDGTTKDRSAEELAGSVTEISVPAGAENSGESLPSTGTQTAPDTIRDTVFPENPEHDRTDTAKHTVPVITGESTGEEQRKHEDHFAAAREEADRTAVNIASLLGIDLDPEHENDPEAVKRDLEELKKVLKVSSPLPVRTLIAIEANGNLVMMSENQRFIFKGQVYDLFNGMKELKTADDIKKYALSIDYKRLGLDPETLNSARIGTGPLQVVIYADPLSDTTHELMEEAITLPDLENYSFYFVIIPGLTGDSEEAALKFYCARQEGNEEAGNLLYGQKLDTLFQTECNPDVWDRTMSAAFYTGVDVVPFLIGSDGRISRGVPSEGFREWLSRMQPADVPGLQDRELKKELGEQITERALRQEAEQNIEKMREEQASGSNDGANPYADGAGASGSDYGGSAGLSPDADGMAASENLEQGMTSVKAQALKDRYEQRMARYARSEEHAKDTYDAIVRRAEGAKKQAAGYTPENRARAMQRIERRLSRAYDDYQEDLKRISDKKSELTERYQQDLQELGE